jgi:hypothetical protein
MDRNIIKRELKESFSWMYRDKRTGKPRRLWKTILLAALYAAAFAWLMHTFYKMGCALCVPMMALDLEWLSFVLMGLLSMFVVGITNAFHAYSSLCSLKEETLLPDGPKAIGTMLWAKFSGTYIMGLFYSLVLMIPGVIVHLQYAKPNLIGFIFTLSIPVLLGLLSLALSCLISYIVFAVSNRIHNKNLLTAILSICFLASYYILYEKSQDIFDAVLESAGGVALWIKRLAYPFYQMGLGAQGNILSMAVFCGTVFLIVAFAGFLLWTSYRRDLLKRKSQEN